jgi:hypothetical protein
MQFNFGLRRGQKLELRDDFKRCDSRLFRRICSIRKKVVVQKFITINEKRKKKGF